MRSSGGPEGSLTELSSTVCPLSELTSAGVKFKSGGDLSPARDASLADDLMASDGTASGQRHGDDGDSGSCTSCAMARSSVTPLSRLRGVTQVSVSLDVSCC